ncbi:MAG TPA: methyltransferase domain-containing protein [Candidatus Nitrosotalea sp.]|nr:methyltransferase domain-containing protein [Candidatus Nitrosotalea sp.]
MKTHDIVSNFLNMYWLRPEVAIWRSLDTIRISKIKLNHPFLDLGCGDGSFLFTCLNGKTTSDFDVYSTIKDTQGFFNGKDIHNQDNGVKILIKKKPKTMVDVGVDWKPNLLTKAKKFGLYKKLIQHDLNKPLPFNDEQFQTIFSNVFYWIDNLEALLLESRRILKHDGNLILALPDQRFKKHLIYNEYITHGHKWAKMLDRGIYENISKHCYSKSKWQSILKKCNLKIKNHYGYMSEEFVKLWSIGLRPYSPFLIEMSNSLTMETRSKIKNRLVKEMTPLLSSYVDFESIRSQNKNCFHLFELVRNN